MAYPPPVPPATRTNATVMATNHPADHNTISAALTEILNHIATLETALYPIGTISMSGADIPPGNHLLCQGQAVSRTTYPEVFALIGTKYGAGDGVNTFNMPSLVGRSPVGFWPWLGRGQRCWRHASLIGSAGLDLARRMPTGSVVTFTAPRTTSTGSASSLVSTTPTTSTSLTLASSS